MLQFWSAKQLSRAARSKWGLQSGDADSEALSALWQPNALDQIFSINIVEFAISHQLEPNFLAANAMLVPIFLLYSWEVYGFDGYNKFPQPQIMTGIQAFIIAIVMTPFWARFALIGMGARLIRDRDDFTFNGGDY